MHAQVRRSLCTFHPNFRIPETFGLVYAESHALGTPVLTHDFGAAAEVVGDPRQLLPVKRGLPLLRGGRSVRCRRAGGACRRAWPRAPGLFDAYVERIRDWRGGARPVVAPDPRFALDTLAAQWRELLGA